MSHMINYPHIASMVFNQPLYATPQLVGAVKSVLEPRLLGRVTGEVDDLAAHLGVSQPIIEARTDADLARQGVTLAGKIAVIPVHGILVPRAGVIDNACNELISYEKLRAQVTVALQHETAEEIVLDFHTGGGAAMGCKELADFIRAATQIKPITAIINFAAYSAGYFLACACSRIVCSPTAGVGSIGVIIETAEISRYEEQMGITYNTYYRGAHKNDCSPHEPISDQAEAEINKRLDEAYELFTGTVSEYRNISVDSVVDTEARLLNPKEALKLKLIDEILPAQDAVNNIAQRYQVKPKSRSIRAQAQVLDMTCKS